TERLEAAGDVAVGAERTTGRPLQGDRASEHAVGRQPPEYPLLRSVSASSPRQPVAPPAAPPRLQPRTVQTEDAVSPRVPRRLPRERPHVHAPGQSPEGGGSGMRRQDRHVVRGGEL